jgi:hypothetical protein
VLVDLGLPLDRSQLGDELFTVYVQQVRALGVTELTVDVVDADADAVHACKKVGAHAVHAVSIEAVLHDGLRLLLLLPLLHRWVGGEVGRHVVDAVHDQGLLDTGWRCGRRQEPEQRAQYKLNQRAEGCKGAGDLCT